MKARPEIELKLSDDTSVIVQDLGARESLRADDYAAMSKDDVDPSRTRAYKTYAVCSVRKIKVGDGPWEPVLPLDSRVEFFGTFDRLALPELQKLVSLFLADWVEKKPSEESDPKDQPSSELSPEQPS
jgi:hypothetical protein